MQVFKEKNIAKGLRTEMCENAWPIQKVWSSSVLIDDSELVHSKYLLSAYSIIHSYTFRCLKMTT